MMSTLIDHVFEVIFHLLIPNEFEIYWIKNGIFRIVIFSIFLRFKGKLLKVLIAFTTGEDFSNEFFHNIEQLMRLVKQETDSPEKKFFTLDCKFL